MITYRRAAELCEDAYHVTARLEAEDCHVVLTEQDGLVVAAFRGSSSLLDWWVDFQMFGHTSFEHDDLGLVHAGFLNDAQAIAPKIIAAVGNKPVFLCGHSKGAGEATLVAGLLSAQGKPPVGLTLFGCPKVAGPGNMRLAGLLGGFPARSFRHCSDPVPEVPAGFCHGVPLDQLGVPSEFLMITDHFISAYSAAVTMTLICEPTIAD